MIVDVIQTPKYYSVYYDGDYVFHGWGAITVWELPDVFAVVAGAEMMRLTIFATMVDIPEREPYPHMDDWQENPMWKKPYFQSTRYRRSS